MKRIIPFIFSAAILSAYAGDYEKLPDDEWFGVSRSMDGTLLMARKDKIVDGQSGWFKYMDKKGTSLQLIYASCSTSQIYTAKYIEYYKNGNVKHDIDGGSTWSIVVPDSQGEMAYKIICNGKDSVDRYGYEFLEYMSDTLSRKRKKR